MKKKIFLRGAFGFPIGISIGYIITIIISFIWANGYYSPCVPELISVMGSEINAVIFQALLSGLLGAAFAASSVIWEIESLNIVKQTGVYFAVVSVVMMPVAYFLYWMEHSVTGFLSYFCIFALIFIVIWVTQFITGRHMVKRMNERLYKSKNS